MPEDGAPVPPWKSWRNLVVPLSLGYLDLITDVSTAMSYYRTDRWWFVLGWAFIIGPALIAAVFFLRHEYLFRRVCAALHIGLLVEAVLSVIESAYSHVLVTLRVVEPLYESVPQLMLQAYALLLEWDNSSGDFQWIPPWLWLPFRLFSIGVSCSSLAYATTGLVAEPPLSLFSDTSDVSGAWCPSLTGIAFASVLPDHGRRVEGYHYNDWQPHNFVWAFFVYQVLEIVSRFFSLALLALVIRAYFFLLLLWLWGSRAVILYYSLGPWHQYFKHVFDIRSQLRLVGMPFMDSVLDTTESCDAACMLTTVEFSICLVVGYLFSADSGGRVPEEALQLWGYVAVGCMVGKLVMAYVIVRPFKKTPGVLANNPDGADKP